MRNSRLSNSDKEIIDRFYEAGKEFLLQQELYTEVVDFEKLLYEDKNYRRAQLLILDIETANGVKLDSQFHEEFSRWWW